MPSTDAEWAEYLISEVNDALGDVEAGHGVADEVLCELLTSLGYTEVVEAWRSVEKQYS